MLSRFFNLALTVPSLVIQASNQFGFTFTNPPVTVQVKRDFQVDRYSVTLRSNSVQHPNQQFDALIDTGSDFTWFIGKGSNCLTDSTGFQIDNQNCEQWGTFEIPYGGGNVVRGTKCRGDLTIMSGGQEAFPLPKQEFGMVTECSDPKIRQPQALLGLARATKNSPSQNPIISRLQPMGYAPQVTVWFAANGQSGELTIGGENPNHSQSKPDYMGMYNGINGNYELITKILASGKDVTQNIYLAKVDTGAQRMFIGQNGAALFYGNINVPKCPTQPNDGTVTYCALCNPAPPKIGLSFSVDGTFGGKFSNTWDIEFWTPSADDKGYCEGSLRGYNGPDGSFLIPSTFMKTYTTTLALADDQGPNRVGLALAKP